VARKVRIEYEGALYHVISRGNYRAGIFESDGACKSFLKCLEQCFRAQGWELRAWVLMPNHYHLCLQTPSPNLVEGMSWLQSTFANRFNRFRKENGHVFQGRYKAILLDADAVGPVCHYIHLNPVRAGMVDCGRLHRYPYSSFHQLWHPRRRWRFANFESALQAAGGLADTPEDRRLYHEYLEWLQEDDAERKRLGFDRMSRGWAIGGGDFKKEVMEALEDERTVRIVEAEAAELREPRWERATRRMLRALDKTEANLCSDRKGASWKVATARMLRERYLAPHRWIADRLKMGTPSTVQSVVCRHRKAATIDDDWWERLQNQETLD